MRRFRVTAFGASKIVAMIAAMVALAGIALGASAQDLETEVELLGALHAVRQMHLDPSIADWEINGWIDDTIDHWRGPLDDGSYRWVLRQRPDSEVVDRSEHLIHGTPDRPSRLEDSDGWVYAVRLVVPRKRSLFRGNESVFVSSLLIRATDEEGETVEDTLQLERWFEPGSVQTWDLEAIMPRASVVVEAAAAPEHRGAALLEVHFLESVERDDPAGPYYGAIRRLGELRSWLTPERIDQAIAEVEKRLMPEVQSIPVASLAAEIERAIAALDSEDEKAREKALAALDEALRLLRND